MKGYPKVLNSRADYEYVMEHFPREEWLMDIIKLLDTTRGWFFVKELATEAEGITDDTHKVVRLDDMQQGEAKYAQYELRENPQCKLLRLGFTVDEIRAIAAA